MDRKKIKVIHSSIMASKDDATQTPPVKPPFWRTCVDFAICFCGLQFSYIIWGMMQELIMHNEYDPTPLNPSGKFPSATFCVFSNRFLAIIVSAIACYAMHGGVATSAPLLAFTPCAVSNTLSSWGQYSALSYVSFSLQTIFKSTKVIPVMFMGILLKGTVYSKEEYFEAAGITVGVLIFAMNKENFDQGGGSNELIGFMLLCLYVLSDSFTSQWQSRLYRDYGKIDSFQMMFGVNVSAIIITTAALVVSGELPLVYEFFQYNPSVLWFNIVTSITSTTGQFAIYYTIKRFGPVVFTIIMTTRQMASIVVSNYYFDHTMSLRSKVGACIVFSVVLFTIWRQNKAKKQQQEGGKPAYARLPTDGKEADEKEDEGISLMPRDSSKV